MRTDIETKAGRVSEYGMSCGYVEAFENDHGRVRLYREHGCYHVRGVLFSERVVESGPSLVEARKLFDGYRSCLRKTETKTVES